MTKEEFLLDTLDYYTVNTYRRSIGVESTGCFYNPTAVNKEGISDGCAIGRHMTPKNKIIADRYGAIKDEDFYKFIPLLPDWMSLMGSLFLRQVQWLHDTSRYWENNSISKSGQDFIKDVLVKHNLDSTKFQKYFY